MLSPEGVSPSPQTADQTSVPSSQTPHGPAIPLLNIPQTCPLSLFWTPGPSHPWPSLSTASACPSPPLPAHLPSPFSLLLPHPSSSLSILHPRMLSMQEQRTPPSKLQATSLRAHPALM